MNSTDKKYVRHQPMRPRANEDDPEVQLRKCLAHDCGEAFLSTWAGNRICPKCTRIINAIDNREEYEATVPRGKGKS